MFTMADKSYYLSLHFPSAVLSIIVDFVNLLLDRSSSLLTGDGGAFSNTENTKSFKVLNQCQKKEKRTTKNR